MFFFSSRCKNKKMICYLYQRPESEFFVVNVSMCLLGGDCEDLLGFRSTGHRVRLAGRLVIARVRSPPLILSPDTLTVNRMQMFARGERVRTITNTRKSHASIWPATIRCSPNELYLFPHFYICRCSFSFTCKDVYLRLGFLYSAT